MSASPRRIFLGAGHHGFGVSERVYLADEWIEIDEADGTEIRRFRVPYEQVLLVTRHRQRPWALVILLGIIGIPSLLTGTLILLGAPSDDGRVGGLIFGVLGLALVVPAVALFAIGTHVVGVYGERSKARLRFQRPQRAQATHDTVIARVRRARRALEGPAAGPPTAETVTTDA